MLLNRKRAEEKMAEYDLDALIATSAANVFYTSNLNPFGNAFVLFPYERDVEPALVASISSVTPITLSSPPWIRDVRYYGEFYTTTQFAEEPLSEAERRLISAQESWERERERNPATILLKLLEEKGLTRGRVGVDESNLRNEHPFLRDIEREFSGLEVVKAQKIFREIRMVKSGEEIRRIKEALRITEKAWAAALEQVREGMTEEEFAEIYQRTIISEGGRISSKGRFHGAPIGFGRRTAFVDIAEPSGYKLRKGDIIRLDGGACYMGYPSDMARTAVLGKPSDKLRRYFNAILKGERLAINMARPGIKPSTIFKAAVEKVREEGIPHFERHHVGHGWGIEGYDPPLVSPYEHRPLEGGMVLDFETPYYEVGWGGIMNEDVVVITEHDARYLTEFSKKLYVIND